MINKTKPVKKHGKRFFVFLVLSIPIIYILIQLFFIFFSKPFHTQTAIKYVLPDDITVDSLIYMPQDVITYDGGIISYIAKDGDRVSPNMALAEVFASTEQAQSSYHAQSLRSELELLRKAQASQVGTNIETLLLQKLNEIYRLMDIIDNEQFLSIDKAKPDLQLAENKLQIAADNTVSFTSRIDELTATAQSEEAMAGSAGIISSPSTGYFVSGQNSTQQMYTAQQLEEMTPELLAQAAKEAPTANTDNVAGKLISDYQWKCYFTVDIKQAEKFIQGGKLSLCFKDVSDSEMPATVLEVDKDEEAGLAKIVLGCDYINGQVITLQSAKATVTFKEYQGLRLDKAALRIIGGVKGVYIKYGNVAEYRKIDILFETENYLLVSDVYEKGVNELRLYDEVIIEGRDLQDGKVI